MAVYPHLSEEQENFDRLTYLNQEITCHLRIFFLRIKERNFYYLGAIFYLGKEIEASIGDGSVKGHLLILNKKIDAGVFVGSINRNEK